MSAVSRESMLVPGLIIASWMLVRLNVYWPHIEQVSKTKGFNPVVSVAVDPYFPAERRIAIIYKAAIKTSGAIKVPRIDGQTGHPPPSASNRPNPLSTRKLPPILPLPVIESPLLPILSDTFSMPAFAQGLDAQADTKLSIQPLNARPARQLARAFLGRLEGSAWILVRNNGQRSISGGNAPTLGSDQAGVRLTAPMLDTNNISLAMTARVSAPLARQGGKEASTGLSLASRAIPGARLFMERRIALDKEISGSWAILATYGQDWTVKRRNLKLRLYAEAGATQSQTTNPFGYARLEAAKPLTSAVDFGLHGVADGQKGAWRVDAGPILSVRLPTAPGTSVSAAWRLKVAGNALPGSGPALSISASF